jgi:phage host-nuclease inhibitor protein Gam
VKRIFWFVIGTLVGVYLVTRLKSRARALAPQSAEKLASAIRHFGDQVREGMEEREAELRDALGIDAEGRHGDR